MRGLGSRSRPKLTRLVNTFSVEETVPIKRSLVGPESNGILLLNEIPSA